ncbi:MAG: hypothetical protein R2912_04115 [Eubacteriales bacterium]
MPIVFRVEPGKMGYDELLHELDFTLSSRNWKGWHAGVDEVSGDFSLKAAIFVENGARWFAPCPISPSRAICEHDEGRDRGWKRPAIGMPQGGCVGLRACWFPA